MRSRHCPKSCARPITLRELDGLSYEEIAQIMNCPIGTVRSRISGRARRWPRTLRPQLGTSKDKRW
jgi:RNA polymerase sigma-70 factor (ECF subfamily)